MINYFKQISTTVREIRTIHKDNLYINNKLSNALMVIIIILLTSIVSAQIAQNNLPDNYLLIENPDGSVTIKNNGNPNEFLEFNNDKFKLGIGSEIIIKENREFELKGRGDLIINGKELSGIENALIKTGGDGKINFAEFISVAGGTYNFDYKNQIFSFTAKKKGRVLFDPENNKITGENTELNYKKGVYGEDKDFVGFKVSGKFSLNLDNNGNLKELIVTDGIFTPDRLFGETNQEFFSKNKKPLHVFFDGTNIKDFNGNAISIFDEKNDRRILIKGQVKGNNLKKSINYDGITDDAYTIFHYDGKSDELGNKDGVAYFDVQQGEANLDNEKHLVYIKDGKAFLRIKNEAREFPTSFKFETAEKTIGFIDEETNRYLVSAFDSENNKITTEISLSELNNRLASTEVLQQLNSEKIRDNLEKRLEEIEQIISSREYKGEKLTNKEIESFKLQKIILENTLDKSEENIDNSIKKLENFISSAKDLEIKANAQILLGELKLERLAQFRASYGSPLAIRESEKARAYFEETVKYVESQLKLNPDSETRERLIQMRDLAKINLAKSYLNDDRSTADLYFTLFSSSENNNLRAEANRLLALSRLSQNPNEQAQFALQSLSQAVKNNPDNLLSKQNLIELQLGLIDARQKQFFGEGRKYLEDIEGILPSEMKGLVGTLSRVFSPISSYYYQFSERFDEYSEEMYMGIEKMDVRYLGSRGMETLIRNDVDMSAYMNSDFLSKLQTVMRTHNFDSYISPDEVRDYSEKLGLTFSEEIIRQDLQKLHNVISQDRGTSVADSFLLDFGKATATMGAIEHAVKFDPMLHLIAGKGDDIRDYSGTSLYNGKQSLENAFTTNRAGIPIERTWTEAIGLEAGDFALSAFAAGGGGGLLAKYGTMGAKAIGLGAKTLTALDIARASFSPGEALALKLLGQTAPKTAFVLGAGLEITGGTALSIIAPEAGAVYDILGITTGGAPGGKGKLVRLSEVTDNLGNTRTLAIVDELAYRNLKSSSGVSVLENGVLLTKDGTRFATKVPEGLRELGSLDVGATATISRELIPTDIPKLSREKLDNWIETAPTLEHSLVRAKVADNIEHVSFDEFKTNLDKSVDKLNSELQRRGKPYVHLLGGTSTSSNRWVAELAKDRMTPPKYTNYYGSIDISKIKNQWISEGEGIDTFVIMDDASFSGEQMYDYLQGIKQVYKDLNVKPTVFITTPYITKYAENFLESYGKSNNIDVRIISEKYIRSLDEILTKKEIELYGPKDPMVSPTGNYLPGLTYFDHKIPDLLSFDVEARKLFERGYHPIYKKMNTDYYKKVHEEFLDSTGKINIDIGRGEQPIINQGIREFIESNSLNIRTSQQALADNARQIDLPQSEITRIRAGDFTESEFARIEDAKSVLREGGFDNELKLLDDPRNQEELLLSHYSGNLPEGINPLAKFRYLRELGFSSDSLRALGDEYVLGNKINIFDVSAGKSSNIEEFYKISDPDGWFGRGEPVSLGQIRRTIDGIADDPDILGSVQDDFKTHLLSLWGESSGDNKKIAEEFLKAMRIEIPAVERIIISSSIEINPSLLRLSEDAIRNQQIQRELQHLEFELGKGNLEAGLGAPGHIESTSIFYLRGRNGGRLYYRKTEFGYEIVAKSAKGRNQDQVINKIIETYSN